MITIDQACDYIIMMLDEAGESLNLLKLQKLLYYTQAWHLAFNSEQPLFDGKFQAWIHGPVNRTIYDRFADTKSLYSDVNRSDLRVDFDPDSLPETAKRHIGSVLEAYASYSGSDLEDMTHREEPWISARTGYRPSQRCEVEINEAIMTRFYKARLTSSTPA